MHGSGQVKQESSEKQVQAETSTCPASISQIDSTSVDSSSPVATEKAEVIATLPSLSTSRAASDRNHLSQTDTRAPSLPDPLLPDPSLPAPSLAEDEAGFTAADLIAHQARLEAQANEAIPFKFDTCTYSMGYIRQPVFACKTCGGGGVCAGCSVSCHSDHDLVELFNKREFRCDCGTPNLYKDRQPNHSHNTVKIEQQLEYPANASPCNLRKPGFDPQNEDNLYNQNFVGSFCYCDRGKTYDAENEDETMFQCLVCEEWLHENCTSLGLWKKQIKTTSPETEVDLEPPLIDHELFDLIICDACVRNPAHKMLRTYAGSRGWMVVIATEQVTELSEWDGINKIQVPTQEAARTTNQSTQESRQEPEKSWQIFGLDLESSISPFSPLDNELQENNVKLHNKEHDEIQAIHSHLETSLVEASSSASVNVLSGKRSHPINDGDGDSLASTVEMREAKRVRKNSAEETKRDPTPTMTPLCSRPSPMAVIETLPHSVTDKYVPALSTREAKPTQRCDIFLSETFRERICKCDKCLQDWTSLPFVLEPEQTYSPPSDHDDASLRDDDAAASVTSSTYDLGMAALRSMPREKMINSLHAYSKFKDALWDHLRPFAGTGKMVREEDVRAFFQKTLETGKR